MRIAAAVSLIGLVLVAGAEAAPDWSLAEAKHLLASRQFTATDRTQASSPSFTFRVRSGAVWRLRPGGGLYRYSGPADDQLTGERLELSFTFLAGGRVRDLRGPSIVASQPKLPIRAAFYYPWFPRNWRDGTNFHPSLGLYDSDDAGAIRSHIRALLWGNVDAAIYSWWGLGDRTDRIFARYLALARTTPLRFAIYYEPEGYGTPSLDRLRRDLDQIFVRYAHEPAYLRIGGRPVVLAWGDGVDTCATPTRWRQANRGRFYVVLKVFTGFQFCGDQPEGWHQYSPALSDDSQAPWAYTISPGFHRFGGEPARLERDLARWRRSIASMVASGARLQLITSYNEWNEGTSVESAEEWATPSGFGAYLDALHEVP